MAAQKTAPTLENVMGQLSGERDRLPELIAAFMKKNFHFVNDDLQFHTAEYWQSSGELLKTRMGDCEDYAIFAKDLLEKNGFKAFLLGVYGTDSAHTVTVFKRKHQWWYFDTGEISYSDADDFYDLATQIKSGWEYVGLLRQEGHRGIISRKFTREKARVRMDEVLTDA